MAKRSTQSDEALPTEGGSQPESYPKMTTPCFRWSPDSTLLSTSNRQQQCTIGNIAKTLHSRILSLCNGVANAQYNYVVLLT